MTLIQPDFSKLFDELFLRSASSTSFSISLFFNNVISSVKPSACAINSSNFLLFSLLGGGGAGRQIEG